MSDKGLEDLQVYQLALDLSDLAWEIYKSMPKQFQYHIGNQFLDSADSVGANIAEGFGRYHYKDSLKFYYNARGSFFENKFWTDRLNSREMISNDLFQQIMALYGKFGLKLNNFINYIKTKI